MHKLIKIIISIISAYAASYLILYIVDIFVQAGIGGFAYFYPLIFLTIILTFFVYKLLSKLIPG